MGRRHPPLDIGLFVLAHVVIVAAFLLLSGTWTASVLYDAGSALTAAVCLAWALHPRRRSFVAISFGGSLAAIAVGDAVSTLMPRGPDGEVPFPSWPDVGYLAGVVLAGAGLLAMAWQAREFFRTAVFDTLLATGGLAVLAVEVGIWPALTADTTPLEKTVATVYALVDFVFVTVAGWLLLSRRSVPPGGVLLAVASVTWFAGDLWFEIVELTGQVWPDGHWPDLLWYVPYALQALAVRVGVRVIPGRGEPGLSSRRLLVAGSVGLLGPAGLIVLAGSGMRVPVPVVALAAVVPLAAALARMYGMLRSLEDQALQDTLTGLWNRRAFVDHAQHLLAQGRLAGVVLIDLDGFKAVNDTFGHAAGNEVLVATARRLQEGVPRGCQVARLGGDEFAVLVPRGVRADLAALERTLAVPVRYENQMLDGVGASLGWGRIGVPPADASLELALAAADAGMYEAKRARKAAALVPQQRDVPGPLEAVRTGDEGSRGAVTRPG